MVSLEDFVKEIVSEISDEFDDTLVNFSQIDGKNYIFGVKINFNDFYRIIDVDEDFSKNEKESQKP